jgi:hypothetical protein
MFEILFLVAAAFVAVFLFGLFLKVLFAILVLPFTLLGWLFGGLWQLISLPFQFLGWILGAVLIGAMVAVLFGLGVPFLIVGALGCGLLLTVAAFCWVGSLFLGT